MQPTAKEAAAARQLADALLEFVVAFDEGCAIRRSRRPRDEIAVRVEHVGDTPHHAPAPAAPPVPENDYCGLLDVKETCKYLSIGSRLLWSMSAPRGPIPVVRMGRLVRYAISDLELVIQRLRKKPRKDLPT